MCGIGLTKKSSTSGNRLARNRRTPPKSSTSPAPYANITKECGGKNSVHCGESTSRITARSRMRTRIMVASSSTKPHQVPSNSQPSERQTRNTSRNETSGTTMPIDFNASVVQRNHSSTTEDQIVERPSMESTPTRPAPAPGEMVAPLTREGDRAMRRSWSRMKSARESTS